MLITSLPLPSLYTMAIMFHITVRHWCSVMKLVTRTVCLFQCEIAVKDFWDTNEYQMEFYDLCILLCVCCFSYSLILLAKDDLLRITLDYCVLASATVKL